VAIAAPIHLEWAGIREAQGKAQCKRLCYDPQMEKQPCVYILASRRNGTLYVGVTSNLIKRVYEHRNDLVDGFTKRFGVHDLAWYEVHERMESAILRENQINKWSRIAKIRLIEQRNPNWVDLWIDLTSPSLELGFRQSLPE
jgi:putative endonuclease